MLKKKKEVLKLLAQRMNANFCFDYSGNESISSLERRIKLGVEVMDRRNNIFNDIESLCSEESFGY